MHVIASRGPARLIGFCFVLFFSLPRKKRKEKAIAWRTGVAAALKEHLCRANRGFLCPCLCPATRKLALAARTGVFASAPLAPQNENKSRAG